MSALVRPLTLAARRVERSLEAMESAAAQGSDEDFTSALKRWSQDMAAFGRTLRTVTGKTNAEIAELLVP